MLNQSAEIKFQFNSLTLTMFNSLVLKFSELNQSAEILVSV